MRVCAFRRVACRRAPRGRAAARDSRRVPARRRCLSATSTPASYTMRCARCAPSRSCRLRRRPGRAVRVFARSASSRRCSARRRSARSFRWCRRRACVPHDGKAPDAGRPQRSSPSHRGRACGRSSRRAIESSRRVRGSLSTPPRRDNHCSRPRAPRRRRAPAAHWQAAARRSASSRSWALLRVRRRAARRSKRDLQHAPVRGFERRIRMAHGKDDGYDASRRSLPRGSPRRARRPVAGTTRPRRATSSRQRVATAAGCDCA